MQAAQSPNLVIRLARHIPWAQQYPNVMGPENAYFYFGPETSPGYIVYGNNRISLPMSHLSRQQREGSTYVVLFSCSAHGKGSESQFSHELLSSRYFTAQSGRHYKWRITPHRMEVRFIFRFAFPTAYNWKKKIAGAMANMIYFRWRISVLLYPTFISTIQWMGLPPRSTVPSRLPPFHISSAWTEERA